MFGCQQAIEIGPMSGASNVVYWLKGHGVEPDPALVQAILLKAKEGGRVLSADEVRAAVSAHRAAATG